MRVPAKIFLSLLVYLLSTLCSCSGGGSESGDNDGRTNKTGVRIIHTSIDTVPLGLFQDGVFVVRSSYMETKDYQPVAELPSVLRITRGSRPTDIVRELSFVPSPNTEYSLLVLGQAQDNQVDLELVSETIGRPEKGLGRIRFLNALVGANNARCTISDGLTSNTINSVYGVISDTIEVASGVKNIVVVPSSGEQKSQALDLPDRGEWLIVLAGKNELGFSVLKVVTDLD